jgi:hypothetical protein
MKKIVLILLIVSLLGCSKTEEPKVETTKESENNLILVCSGKESGYKTYLQTGKKTTFENEVKDETYQIENGKLNDMKCEFSQNTIWCHSKGEGQVLVDSYLIYDYNTQIDRFSGKITDYLKEIMTHDGVKTELVKNFVGQCNRVLQTKF